MVRIPTGIGHGLARGIRIARAADVTAAATVAVRDSVNYLGEWLSREAA
jgi:hypothetical protein